MLSTHLSKLLVISASTVSALGLLIAVPHAATAQMSEDMTADSMVTESVEDESMTEDMSVTVQTSTVLKQMPCLKPQRLHQPIPAALAHFGKALL